MHHQNAFLKHREYDVDEEERRVGRPGKLSLTLSLFFSLSSSKSTLCKQPISTRRRERQTGTRCGEGKKGRKRNRNSIAVERVGQSRFLSWKQQNVSIVRFYRKTYSVCVLYAVKGLVATSRRARCELIVVSLFPRRTGAGEIFSRQYHVRSRAARDEENGRRGEGFSSRVWTRLRSRNVELDV